MLNKSITIIDKSQVNLSDTDFKAIIKANIKANIKAMLK